MHTCEEINKKHKRDMDEVEGGTCYWANLPPELLREVLIKLEKSESKWPARKNVVACAGVCKSWRQIIKELVKTLEVSGKITFPISVKQPGPREYCVQCFVKRNRATQMHYLYLSLSEALADDGKFLLAARRFRRPRFTEYIISLHPLHICRSNGFYIGKLRSNFLGNKFVVYDALPPHAGAKLQTRFTQNVGLRQISPRIPAGNYPVAQITYEMNVLGARNPRRIHCIMDAIPASAIKPGGVAPTQIDFTISNADSFLAIPFSGSKSNVVNKSQSTPLDDGEKGPPLVLKNEAPRWNQQLHCWCLNFHGRVTVASVKNFQLVASPENGLVGAEKEKIFLQFGKVGKDVFTMDYCYPLSAFQAFAISLSSFDTKSTCE